MAAEAAELIEQAIQELLASPKTELGYAVTTEAEVRALLLFAPHQLC